MNRRSLILAAAAALAIPSIAQADSLRPAPVVHSVGRTKPVPLNPHLDPEYIAALKRLPPHMRNRWLRGEWCKR